MDLLWEEGAPWAWLVLGLILVGLEVVAPGVFLLWLGLAALGTGIAVWAAGLTWQAALICFAALAVASVLAGRAIMRRPGDSIAEQPWLNRRGEALVGRTFVLDAPIRGGEGRIRIDDSVWRAVGPDLPVGATVRVARLDGATLHVEAFDP